ncbi:hypothetical protein LCGC14_0246290 [marine sediment metagenome]|uniref:Uncharacterized protein n=1 Tax=marine sediment metagenome TaxID=412755 RepID=A0A0F9XAQ7_9ZZZZ
MELQEVLDSKVFVKGSSISFNSPKKYIEPFMERVEKLSPSWITDVSAVVSNAEEEGDMNTAYGRVLVQGLLPGLGTDDSRGIIGMVYALDTVKPVVRVFTGQNVSVCMNLCIFGTSHLFSADLLGGGMDAAYKKVEEYVEGKEEEVKFYVDTIGELKSTEYDSKQVDEIVGALLREALTGKLGSSSIIAATRKLNNPSSRYSMVDGHTTGWNIYNAVTEHISHKVDIFDRAVKTQILSSLMLN